MLQVITKIAKWFWGVSECKSLMLENNLCFKKAMMCTQKLSGFADDNGKPRVLSKLAGGKSSKKRGTSKYWKAFKLEHEAKSVTPRSRLSNLAIFDPRRRTARNRNAKIPVFGSQILGSRKIPSHCHLWDHHTNLKIRQIPSLKVKTNFTILETTSVTLFSGFNKKNELCISWLGSNSNKNL